MISKRKQPGLTTEQKLRKLIRLEVKKLLNEGYDGECGKIANADSKEIAIQNVQKRIDFDKRNDGDLRRFLGVKWVGEVSEDRLDKLADQYKNQYVTVGMVDGEYWMAYWRKS